MHVQDGRTALYIASKNGHIAIVNFLLQAAEADIRICQKVYTRFSFSMCNSVGQAGANPPSHVFAFCLHVTIFAPAHYGKNARSWE